MNCTLHVALKLRSSVSRVRQGITSLSREQTEDGTRSGHYRLYTSPRRLSNYQLDLWMSLFLHLCGIFATVFGFPCMWESLRHNNPEQSPVTCRYLWWVYLICIGSKCPKHTTCCPILISTVYFSNLFKHIIITFTTWWCLIFRSRWLIDCLVSTRLFSLKNKLLLDWHHLHRQPTRSTLLAAD